MSASICLTTGDRSTVATTRLGPGCGTRRRRHQDGPEPACVPCVSALRRRTLLVNLWLNMHQHTTTSMYMPLHLRPSLHHPLARSSDLPLHPPPACPSRTRPTWTPWKADTCARPSERCASATRCRLSTSVRTRTPRARPFMTTGGSGTIHSRIREGPAREPNRSQPARTLRYSRCLHPSVRRCRA